MCLCAAVIEQEGVTKNDKNKKRIEDLCMVILRHFMALQFKAINNGLKFKQKIKIILKFEGRSLNQTCLSVATCCDSNNFACIRSISSFDMVTSRCDDSTLVSISLSRLCEDVR